MAEPAHVKPAGHPAYGAFSGSEYQLSYILLKSAKLTSYDQLVVVFWLKFIVWFYFMAVKSLRIVLFWWEFVCQIY